MMNVAMGAAHPELAAAQGVGEAVESVAPQSDTFQLRRSGQRPIAFRGIELGHAMSFRVGTPFWYEVNLFQVDGGGFVADVRMFTKSDGERDLHSVHVGASLEDVVSFLEDYDPAKDVSVDVDFDDPALTTADLAFKALAVRARLDSARQQYASLVSEVLSQLDESVLAGLAQR